LEGFQERIDDLALAVFVQTFFALGVYDAHMQGLGMQIDAAVDLVLGIEETHLVSPWVLIP
jgi:hypothetical protein